jgi:hypothetical protein
VESLRAALACGLVALALHTPAWGGTTGKISGRVLDTSRQPLPGANIAVPLARTGAVSDVDGRYVILNLPAGTYDVRVTLIGYGSTTVQEVVVSADQTTSLDISLGEAPLQLEEVVITAERPVVDLNLTSNISTVSWRSHGVVARSCGSDIPKCVDRWGGGRGLVQLATARNAESCGSGAAHQT